MGRTRHVLRAHHPSIEDQPARRRRVTLGMAASYQQGEDAEKNLHRRHCQYTHPSAMLNAPITVLRTPISEFPAIKNLPAFISQPRPTITANPATYLTPPSLPRLPARCADPLRAPR